MLASLCVQSLASRRSILSGDCLCYDPSHLIKKNLLHSKMTTEFVHT